MSQDESECEKLAGEINKFIESVKIVFGGAVLLITVLLLFAGFIFILGSWIDWFCSRTFSSLSTYYLAGIFLVVPVIVLITAYAKKKLPENWESFCVVPLVALFLLILVVTANHFAVSAQFIRDHMIHPLGTDVQAPNAEEVANTAKLEAERNQNEQRMISQLEAQHGHPGVTDADWVRYHRDGDPSGY